METCKACHKIPLKLFDSRYHDLFTLHPSLDSLLASASAGCKFCIFLRRQLAINSATALPQPSKIWLFNSSPTDDRVCCQIDEPRPRNIEMPRRLSTSFQYSVEPFEGKRRPITGVTRSKETFRQINRWLYECAAGHPKCGLQDSHGVPGFVPTRLIDLRPMTASSGDASPKLILTSDLSSKHVDYITLSYVRGSDVSQDANDPQVQTTTEGNLNEHLSFGIPCSKLPLTIREGIEIAQRLQIRYIWDSSLCIIQDSASDRKLESALIPEIFAHAYVTIAASASANIHGGFFRKSEMHTEQDSAVISVSSSASTSRGGERDSVQILVMKEQPPWGRSFEACPLNKSTWVMQEREFSPRIVHFTEKQVLWECRFLRATEGWPELHEAEDDWPRFPLRLLDGLQEMNATGGDHAPALKRSDMGVKFTVVSRSKHELKPARDHAPAMKRNDMWLQTVVNYSLRRSKNEEDKFPALASLAQIFASHTKIPYDHYVAGFWKEDLLRSLAWGCESVGTTAAVTNTRHERYVAPSWSWASVEGPLDFGYLRTMNHPVFSSPDGSDAPEAVKLMPKVLGAHLPRVEPADDPFGRLREGGELRLRGYMVRAVLGYDSSYCSTLGQQILLNMAHDPRHERDFTRKTEAVGTMYFDVPSERAALNPREEVLALYVHPWKCPSAEYRFKDGGKGICGVGIALVRTGGMSEGVTEREYYKRVGHVRPLSVQCFEGAREQEIVII